MADDASCQKCGQPLPARAPKGLCPRCLLQIGLAPERALVTPPPAVAPVTDKAAQTTRHSLPFRYFADYELLGEIARGGMGVVYRARQISLNRLVALKMISAGRLATPQAVERFHTETEAAALLDHPNIVPIYQVGEEAGMHYFSMKLIEGGPLSERISNPESPISHRQAAKLLAPVARAVHYAHQHGILHRDLKPGNILLDTQGQPYVTDFGLAKFVIPPSGGSGDPLTAGTPNALTHSLAVIGTPSYMAPEQAAGQSKHLTTAADVYSLGAILYELLAGRPPFIGENELEILRRVVDEDPVPPSIACSSRRQEAHEINSELRTPKSEIDQDLEIICLKCLRKEPHLRYGSADALAVDLEHWLAGETIAARPASTAERAWRWCRRKPALASAFAGLLTVFALGFAGVLWQWQRANRHADEKERERRFAVQQRQRAEAAVTRLELERAEGFFAAGDTAQALAGLGRILRREPTNRVAAERVMSALSHRRFSIPATPPFRHSSRITGAEFNTDGSQVLTASEDGTVKVWDAHTGASVRGPFEHPGPVLCARFSTDGKWIISGCQDNVARIWDVAAGKMLTSLQHEGAVVCAEFSPDGTRAVTGSMDKTARLWNARTGEALCGPLPHNDWLVVARFSPDGRRVLTAEHHNNARVWDGFTGQPLTGSMRDKNKLLFAEFSPDGSKVLIGGVSWFLGVWDLTSGKRAFQRIYHQGIVQAARFSPDGCWIVSAGAEDNCVRFCDAQTGEPLPQMLKHYGTLRSVEWSRDGQKIITASNDKTARLWDARTGVPITEPLQHDSAVVLARLSSDGQRALTVTEGAGAWVWVLRTGPAFSQQVALDGVVNMARFSSDSRCFVTAKGSDMAAQVWDSFTGQPKSPPLRDNVNFPLLWAEFSPDGKTLVAGGWVHTLNVWSLQDAKLLHKLKHANSVRAGQFAPDGRTIVTACDDGTGQIWDAATGTSLSTLRHMAALNSVHVSPDSRLVVTASRDKTAQVWTIPDGRVVGQVLRHQDEVYHAQFSPDGRRVVTASKDKTAQVWHASTGQRWGEAIRHDDAVVYAGFSPDEHTILTLAGNTAFLRSSLPGQAFSEPLQHDARINSARFSPDSQLVVTASQDGTARVWDAMTGHPVSEPMRHDDAVTYAEFSRDGRWIVTAGKDGKVRVWEALRADLPVPVWLPELAGGFAGRRFNALDASVPVPVERLFQLRQALMRSSATGPLTDWAKWLFNVERNRTMSVSSPVTHTEYLQRLTNQNHSP